MPPRIPLEFPLLDGDMDDEDDPKSMKQPQVWLRKMERFWESTITDAEKLRDITMSLEPDSTAEIWWTALAAGDKDTYTKAQQLFKDKWPKVQEQEQTMPAKREILRELVLKEEDLGKWIGEGKKKNYTHVVWADKALKLWRDCDDPGGHLLDDVRRNLPEPLRYNLGLTPADENKGDKFFAAVKAVRIDNIMRLAHQASQLRDISERLASMTTGTRQTQNHSSYATPSQVTFYPSVMQSQAPTPAAARYVAPYRRPSPPPHQQAPQTPVAQPRLQQPTPANTSPNNPFNTATPRPHNTFYQQVMQTPSSPLEARQTTSASLARHAAANSHPFTDDEAGRTAYARAMEEWSRVNPGAPMATFTTGLLPLSPGSARLGSRECFRCGKIPQPHHTMHECPVLQDQHIPGMETQWRSYISRFIYPTNMRNSPYGQRGYSPTTPLIAQMGFTAEGEEYNTGVYPAELLEFEDGTMSGKGLESRR